MSTTHSHISESASLTTAQQKSIAVNTKIHHGVTKRTASTLSPLAHFLLTSKRVPSNTHTHTHVRVIKCVSLSTVCVRNICHRDKCFAIYARDVGKKIRQDPVASVRYS